MRSRWWARAVRDCARRLMLAGLAAGWSAVETAAAQPLGRLTVRVASTTTALPLAGASVAVDTVRVTTDRDGIVVVLLAPRRYQIQVARVGFEPDSSTVTIDPGGEVTVAFSLRPVAVELEDLTVHSTRSGRRVEDQALRVEVLDTEEVEEKLLMTPGDITMLLNETPGVRIQGGASTLGSAAIRIQGLRGRYTAVLSDGLPLHGAQVGGLGPLQIPPMDLAQVELIKGAAAALYGPAAMGGVINLISRDPEPGTDLLFNATTLGGADAVALTAGTAGGGWRYSLLAGGHHQSRRDINRDGFADVPGYDRLVLRPRFRWSDRGGASLLLVGGTTIERRRGGTLDGRAAPDGVPFVERLATDQFDAGVVASWPLGQGWQIAGRSSLAARWHRRTWSFSEEPDRHLTGLVELTALRRGALGSWLVGAAWGADQFRYSPLPGSMDYDHSVPAVFVQGELDPDPRLAVTASARLDRHNRYGTFVSPRISTLLRPGGTWQVRFSGGGRVLRPDSAHRPHRAGRPLGPGPAERASGRASPERLGRRRSASGPSRVPSGRLRVVDRTSGAGTTEGEPVPAPRAGQCFRANSGGGSRSASAAADRKPDGHLVIHLHLDQRTHPGRSHSTHHSLDAPTCRWHRRGLGAGRLGSDRARALLHRPAGTRRRSLPERKSPIRGGGVLGRTEAGWNPALPQRRERDRPTAKPSRAPGSALAGSRRSVARGCLGALGWAGGECRGAARDLPRQGGLTENASDR
ncbi:MAG: TonB-dependent receptor [Gemmatimonadetes bacterium]|nr:TonB-dependent receptor [Gemmatimonadota bacterium]